MVFKKMFTRQGSHSEHTSWMQNGSPVEVRAIIESPSQTAALENSWCFRHPGQSPPWPADSPGRISDGAVPMDTNETESPSSGDERAEERVQLYAQRSARLKQINLDITDIRDYEETRLELLDVIIESRESLQAADADREAARDADLENETHKRKEADIKVAHANEALSKTVQDLASFESEFTKRHGQDVPSRLAQLIHERDKLDLARRKSNRDSRREVMRSPLQQASAGREAATEPESSEDEAEESDPEDADTLDAFDEEGEERAPQTYFEHQSARQCAVHAVNNYAMECIVTAARVAVHSRKKEMAGPFTIRNCEKEVPDKYGQMYSQTLLGGDEARRTAVLAECVRALGRVIVTGEGTWPGGTYAHAAVLVADRGRVGLIDSDVPSTRTQPLWVGEGSLLSAMPMVSTIFYWSTTGQHARHATWAIGPSRGQASAHRAKLIADNSEGGPKRPRGDRLQRTITAPDGNTVTCYVTAPTSRERSKQKKSRQAANENIWKKAHVSLGLEHETGTDEHLFNVPTRAPSRKRKQSTAVPDRSRRHAPRLAERLAEVPARALGDYGYGRLVLDEEADKLISHGVNKVFNRIEHPGTITAYNHTEVGTLFKVTYTDGDEDEMFVEEAMACLAIQQPIKFLQMIYDDAGAHALVQLKGPPSLETLGQRQQRWAENDRRTAAAIVDMGMIVSELNPYRDQDIFPTAPTMIVADTVAEMDSPSEAESIEMDALQWEPGEVLDHKYTPEGCYYQVEDTGRLLGDANEYEFTEREIAAYKKGANGQSQSSQEGGETRLLNGKYHVKWNPYWVHGTDLGEDAKNGYFKKLAQQRREVETQPGEAPAANYVVNTDTCNPDLDIQPGEPSIHLLNKRKKGRKEKRKKGKKDKSKYVIYGADGHAKSTISSERLKRLASRWVNHNQAGTKTEFLTAIGALVERYAPNRKATHNKLLKAQYKNEWALKHSLTGPICKLLGIRHELFSHPLNDNETVEWSWAPSARDKEFGSKHDSYSWSWHDLCMGNPEYTPTELLKFTKHAIQAAKTAPADQPVATVAFLPYFTDHDYTNLLDSDACRIVWAMPRKKNFNFNPPDYWTGSGATPDQADFALDLYVIANKCGWEHLQAKCTDPTAEGYDDPQNPEWNKLHSVLEIAEITEEWEDVKYYSPDAPVVGRPWAGLRSYHCENASESDPTHTRASLGREVLKHWELRSEPPPLRWKEEQSMSTDGGKSEGTGKPDAESEGEGNPSRSGGGVHSSNEDRRIVFEGRIQTAHRGELLAIREAVRMAGEQSKVSGQVEWFIFTDSLVSLHTLARYQRWPASLANNPAKVAIEEIATIINEHKLQISFHKVKAHVGISGNEEADTLATEACKGKGEIRTVSNLPDTIDGVLMEQLRPNPDGGYSAWALPFRQHYAPLYEREHLYPAATPSLWRTGITKKEEDGNPWTCKPMVKGIRDRWTESHNRTWLKACHNEFMTQRRAAAYTYLPPYRRAKNIATEARWRKTLRREIALLPPLPTVCPLCGKEEDGLMHTLLHCEHIDIQNARIARHNRILARVLRAVRAGRRGKW